MFKLLPFKSQFLQAMCASSFFGTLLSKQSATRYGMMLMLLFCLTSASIFAQAPAKLWDNVYGGQLTDVLTTSISTADGGYLLGGYSNSNAGWEKTENSKGSGDYWIVKIGSNGAKQWDKTFGGSNQDELTAMVQTADGGYLLAGSSWSGIGGNKSQANRGSADYWVVKISSSGAKQWDKTFGGSSADILSSVIQTKDGGYLLGGSSRSDNDGDKTEVNRGNPDELLVNPDDYWVVKISSSGAKQWDKTFGGSGVSYYNFGDDLLTKVVQTADGGYLLAGHSRSGISGDKTAANRTTNVEYESYEGFPYDYWVVKISSSGAKQWDKAFGGGGDDFLSALIPTSDGGFLLGGYSASGAGYDKTQASVMNDYWVVKITSSGTKQWDKTFGGSNQDNLKQILPTTDGHFLLAGSSNSPAGRDKTTASLQGSSDYWIVKISTSGAKIWDKTFGGSSTDELTSAVRVSDGSYLLAGYSSSGISSDKSKANRGTSSTFDYWVLKTTAGQQSSACPGTGSISREVWSNVSGISVTKIPLTATPSSRGTLTSFEAPSNAGDNYGQRIRGYLCVTTTGNYTFYLASDDSGELYLSTDENPANKRKIAGVNSAWTNPREWTKFASQKSVTIALTAGRKYYIEALHKEGVGRDNLAVGWTSPNSTAISVIPGSHLLPFATTTTARAKEGVEEAIMEQNLSTNVYPNPFEDKLYVKTSQTGKLEVSLLDNLGRNVYQASKYTQAGELEVGLAEAGLKQGVYLLRLQAEDGSSQIIRVVKK